MKGSISRNVADLFHLKGTAPCSCHRELFGDSQTKILQYLMCQIEMSFICSTGIFSDRETLELLSVSLSFEDFLPCLTFTCFCFICGTALLVFICDYRKCRRLCIPHFLSSGWMSPPFQCVDCHTCLSTFQWNCPTWFCVTVTQCSFINYVNLLIVSFSFIHYPYFVWTATPFCLFSEWKCPTILCVNLTQMSCVSSPLSLCDCHMRVSNFFVWMLDEYPCVSITLVGAHFVSF